MKIIPLVCSAARSLSSLSPNVAVPVLALFALSCAPLATSSVQAQVINETFATSPASNFTVVSGGTWSVSGGQYHLTNPAAGGASGNGNIATHNTSVSGNWTLTVDASVLATTSAWDDFSVIFGYQDANNYYF